MIKTETKTQVICDRCKQEIKHPVIRMFFCRFFSLNIESKGMQLDLCGRCKKGFFIWLEKEQSK